MFATHAEAMSYEAHGSVNALFSEQYCEQSTTINPILASTQLLSEGLLCLQMKAAEVELACALLMPYLFVTMIKTMN